MPSTPPIPAAAFGASDLADRILSLAVNRRLESSVCRVRQTSNVRPEKIDAPRPAAPARLVDRDSSQLRAPPHRCARPWIRDGDSDDGWTERPRRQGPPRGKSRDVPFIAFRLLVLTGWWAGRRVACAASSSATTAAWAVAAALDVMIGRRVEASGPEARYERARPIHEGPRHGRAHMATWECAWAMRAVSRVRPSTVQGLPGTMPQEGPCSFCCSCFGVHSTPSVHNDTAHTSNTSRPPESL